VIIFDYCYHFISFPLPLLFYGSPPKNFWERGRGGRGVWGNSAAPERSAGAKRRRSVSFKKGSDFVKQIHQSNQKSPNSGIFDFQKSSQAVNNL